MANAGFENISFESLGDKNYVVGTFSYENYSFKRTLILTRKISLAPILISNKLA